MAISQDVQQFSQQVDQATNQIASRIQELMNRQQNLSAEDKQEFQRIVDNLNRLGKNQNTEVTI